MRLFFFKEEFTMKFGVCLGYDQHDRIECAAKCGFDYVEISFAAMTQASDEAYSAFLAALARCGIPCESANGFLPGELPTTGDDVNFDALRAFLEKGMARAKEIGIEVVVFGSSASRNLREGTSYRRGAAQLVTFLREVAGPIAAKYGVRIAIEPLRPAESNIINRVKEGMLLAAASGCENVGALGDLYHMAIAGETGAEFDAIPGDLFHTHIANPALDTERPRRYPSDPSEFDYADFIRHAEAAGCPRCSIEAGCEDFDREAPKALEALRKACE